MFTNEAIGFEDKMGNVATLIDTSTESIDAMGDSILRMATDEKIPVGINDMASGLYQVRSAGIDRRICDGRTSAVIKAICCGSFKP